MHTPRLPNTALSAALVLSAPAAAREADLRIHLPAPVRPTPSAAPTALPNSIQRILTLTDREALQAAQSRAHETRVGPFELSLTATRLKGTHVGGDRYSMRTAGFDLGLDLGDGVGLRSEVLFTHMKRHLPAVPNGNRARSTGIAMLGLGIVRESGPALMIDYIRVGTLGRRTALERMTEIAGGAPLAGSGMRLAYLVSPAEPVRGRAQWSFAIASLRRPPADFSSAPSETTTTDKRAEISLRVPL